MTRGTDLRSCEIGAGIHKLHKGRSHNCQERNDYFGSNCVIMDFSVPNAPKTTKEKRKKLTEKYIAKDAHSSDILLDSILTMSSDARTNKYGSRWVVQIYKTRTAMGGLDGAYRCHVTSSEQSSPSWHGHTEQECPGVSLQSPQDPSEVFVRMRLRQVHARRSFTRSNPSEAHWYNFDTFPKKEMSRSKSMF